MTHAEPSDLVQYHLPEEEKPRVESLGEVLRLFWADLEATRGVDFSKESSAALACRLAIRARALREGGCLLVGAAVDSSVGISNSDPLALDIQTGAPYVSGKKSVN